MKIAAIVGARPTASKLGLRLAHVEAGLRSFDRTMPEEINRVLTDSIADLLFTTEPAANENLAREGIPGDRVHYVGNVMIDTLFRYRERARASSILETLSVEPSNYSLLTLHRPSNVDTEGALRPILGAVARIQAESPVVFPVHPPRAGFRRRPRRSVSRASPCARTQSARSRSAAGPNESSESIPTPSICTGAAPPTGIGPRASFPSSGMARPPAAS